jgi:threonine dehydratase
MMIPFWRVLEARNRIAGRVLRTPMRSAALSRPDAPILLKCEHHQTTGSFKLRGATNAVLSLTDEQRAAAIAAASTGNHGRAIAHACRAAGARAVICMSRLVPDNKVSAIRALGAEVHIIGDSQDEAQGEVDRLVADGMVAVSPFDDPAVIAGQGTLGLEIMEDAPDLDAVLVPLSGGGLISGIALAVKAVNPETRVIGISMERGAAMAASLAAGRPVEVREERTLADSLGGGIGLDNRHTFAMVRDLVDEVILLDEAAIAAGIRHAYEAEGEVIEGAGAVGLGAVIAGRFVPRGPTAVLLSGRNIAPALHRRVVAGETPMEGA